MTIITCFSLSKDAPLPSKKEILTNRFESKIIPEASCINDDE